MTMFLPSLAGTVCRDKMMPRPITVVLLVRSPSSELDLVVSNL